MSSSKARPQGVLKKGVSLTALTVGLMALATNAFAQGATEVIQDEIVITATKRGDALVQDVPLAVTAFSSEQLQALNFQDLQSLSYVIPNVQFEDIGTSPNFANFGIRGLGVASTIPSVDPTVGIFIDGMYLGVQAGSLTDNFDVEAIEVLRGPQGTLYGRNVTGGAVLIRTRAPTDDFQLMGRAGVETGLRHYQDVAISGPLLGEMLAGRAAVYHTDDDGWFHNDFNGQEQGASEMTVIRGALAFHPTPGLDFIVRGEHLDSDSDGPASQNHALFARGSFDFSIDNPGYARLETQHLIGEMNWDVPFGDGKVTGIVTWRDYEGTSNSDIDATPGHGFHARSVLLNEQMSGELRYAGTLNNVDLTTGLYYFTQSQLYIEERSLAGGAILRVGGGDGDFDSWGAFVNTDWRLNDAITVNAGVRYSEENKEARISRLRRAGDALDAGAAPGSGVIGGSIDGRFLNYSDSPFDLSWSDVSPRIGIQWEPSDDTNLYAFWARGFRSGGVNFRVTTFGNAIVSGAPTAFDSEEQSSFEIGLKQDFMGGRGRINLALFHNTIDGIQRETNVADPVAGVQQVIVNAGEAVLKGAEAEFRFALLDNLIVAGQVGYTDDSYNEITADLNGDGTVNGADKALRIPRVAPWTYGVSLIHDLDIPFGTLSSRVSYNHRDANFYTDNNLGRLEEIDVVDANLTFRPTQGPWEIAVYGTNLTNEASYGGDTQLPDAGLFGGDGAGPRPPPTFSPLNRGRIVGAELRLRY